MENILAQKNSINIKWSIIIPHYNQPRLLDRLLFSIPWRKDLEVIVVDDDSDLGFRESIELLKKKYPTYRFITTEVKGGGGLARNTGIKEAKGDYIIFADSDDYFLPTFNDILDKYITTEADIIFFNIISLDNNTGNFCSRWKHIDRYFQAYNKSRNDLPLRYLFGEPWGKIIRRGLIIDHNIQFDVLPIHNDTTFSYLVGYYAQTIIVENVRAYCLTFRIGSVSNIISLERLEIRLNVFAKKYIFFKEYGIPVFDELLVTPFWFCIKRRNYDQFHKYILLLERYKISRVIIFSHLLVFIFGMLKNKVTSYLSRGNINE